MTRPGDFFADQGQRLAAVFGEAHAVSRLGELLLQQRADVGSSSTTRIELVALLVAWSTRFAQLA